LLDAALSNLNHPRRDEISRELLGLVAAELKPRNSDVLATDYLPPMMPEKYCGWIQGLLNK
jgi:hypothetical protein